MPEVALDVREWFLRGVVIVPGDMLKPSPYKSFWEAEAEAEAEA